VVVWRIPCACVDSRPNTRHHYGQGNGKKLTRFSRLSCCLQIAMSCSCLSISFCTTPHQSIPHHTTPHRTTPQQSTRLTASHPSATQNPSSTHWKRHTDDDGTVATSFAMQTEKPDRGERSFASVQLCNQLITTATEAGAIRHHHPAVQPMTKPHSFVLPKWLLSIGEHILPNENESQIPASLRQLSSPATRINQFSAVLRSTQW